MRKFVGILLGCLLAFSSAVSVSPIETEALSLAFEVTPETIEFTDLNEEIQLKSAYETQWKIGSCKVISGEECITVDSDNVVKPLKNGTATILVTSATEGHTDYVYVTVSLDEFTEYRSGDINLDDKISVSDAVMLQKYLICSQVLTDLQLLAADVNCDGAVNVFDYVLLKRKIIQNQPEYTVKTDMTNAAYQLAWDDAMSENKTAVLTSSEELDEYLTERFRSPVIRSLEKTYDEEFFSENILIIDLYAQNYRDDWITEVSGVFSNGETIDIRYNNTFIDGGGVYESLMITQVAVPKSCYNGENASRSKSWEKNISASNTEYDLGMLSEATGKQLNEIFSKDGAWINSAEELDAYLKECLTEDGMTEVGNYISEGIDFDNESVYIWMDTDIIGSTHTVMNTAVFNSFDNYIDLTYNNYQPVSCMGGSFLHILKTDKEYYGKAVKLRSFLSDKSGVYLRADGGLFRYYPSSNIDIYKSLYINQYSFGSEGAIDIYWAYPGGGGSEFSSFENVGSLEVPVGTLPFSEDYAEETDANGNTVYAGENFSITWRESSVVVKFRTKDSTETTSYEIPYE